jgi:hypothetical protein
VANLARSKSMGGRQIGLVDLEIITIVKLYK